MSTAVLNRRSHLINPDTRPVLIVAAAITATLGAVSFLGSAAGLMGVAPSALREAGQSWAVPVAIDGGILVYTLAILVKRRRAERAPFAWVALLAFTLFSSATNALHAWETSAQGTEGLLEAAVAAVLPLAVFAATHTLADLIVDPEPTPEEVPVEAPVRRIETQADVEALVREASAEGAVLAEAMFAAEDADEVKPARLLPRAERDALIRANAALGARGIEREHGIPKSTAARVLASK